MSPSRRAFLGAAAGSAGLAVAGGVGYAVTHAEGDEQAAQSDATPFYGEHQAGIATPAQERLAFASFDVVTEDKAKLATMLGRWSAAAARMSLGQEIGDVEGHRLAPPIDTGEALGLTPGHLTITVGFGPSLFDRRFGFAGLRPAALADLPTFGNESMDPTRVGGDICVQACSNDPQVAFHAVRNLTRLGRGVVVLRWTQLGFGRTSSTSQAQATPRNLMGFKDGTNNIKAENAAEMGRFVWAGAESDQNWIRGGSYLVARRIRMLIETWDSDDIEDQERIFGRVKSSGAPLTGGSEFTPIDFAAKRADGTPVIDLLSHVRLSSPESHQGMKILRRGYSYTDGTDPRTGQLDAGLFFIAFQQDPRTQFVALQTMLGRQDSLNEYRHTGSGLFAVPPGVTAPGDWFGRELFES